MQNIRGWFGTLPKIIGLVVLNVILLSSVFGWWGAQLSNQAVSIAIMVLLLSLISDLKEFDFWGLKGKSKEQQRIQQQIVQTKDKTPVNTSKIRRTARPKAKSAESLPAQPTYLMGDVKANFLQLSFDLERILRQAAKRLGEAVEPSTSASNVTDMLVNKGLLTAGGKEQMDIIRAIRNLIVYGRDEEIDDFILQTGWDMAYNLYSELYTWLYGPVS